MRILAPHFDRRFYLRNNGDVAEAKVDPLLHFVRHGHAERRDPSPAFCMATYVMRYPQAVEKGANAFLHYLQTGIASGALIDAVDEIAWCAQSRCEIELQREEFDPVFYKAKNVDIGAIDPLYHFAKFGWLERRDPTPSFSTAAYLELNPDVAAAGVNPFFHWIAEGKKEGRPIGDPQAEQDLAFQLNVMRSHFDERYYLLHLQSDLPEGLDALIHFAKVGWRRGRNPNRSFSVTAYLSMYEDVRLAGVNPFYHYLVEGRREGRHQQPHSNYRCNIIADLRSLEEDVAASHQWAADIDVDYSTLAKILLEAASDRYAITISHDDYATNVGGVQLCLRRESAEYLQRDVSHIHLFPRCPALQISRRGDLAWGVLLDGSLLGHIAAASFLACLIALTARGAECVSFVVHSLLGHTAELVIKAAKASAVTEAVFWVHDYSAVCAGLRLMRNDVEWCNAPPPDSSACRVCIYGAMRSEQISEFEALFAGLPFRAIAPSEVAASIFAKHHPLLPLAVREHLFLRQTQARERKPGAVRIAFLGHPAAHKGWYDFIQLVEAYAERSDVVFYHIASDGLDMPNIQHVRALPDRQGRSTFPEAVANLTIDFVFVGSLWRETFCLVAYEAVAGGAELLTYAISGQPVLLARQGHGHVFECLPELIAFVGARLAADDMRTDKPQFEMEFTSQAAPLHDALSSRTRYLSGFASNIEHA